MMMEPNQNKVLLVIIAILILANGVTLALLLNKPGHKAGSKSRKENMEGYLKKDIGFNEKQIATYDSLHTNHKREVEEMYKGMKLAKEKNFKYLAENDFSDTLITLTGRKSGDNQEQLEVKMLSYLKEIRKIATPEQRLRFDTSFYKFMNKSRSKKKGKD
jgi:Spy/CpxP family protein refolding chaperone